MEDHHDRGRRRVRLLISGRVQGVSFRAHAEEQATDLGLAGWVRNRRSGQVELVAEGDLAAIDALLRWCAHGPPAARVTGVEVQDEAPSGGSAGFRVLPTQ